MTIKIATTGWVLALGLGLAAAGPASAAITPIDTAKVSNLSAAIESALSSQGCGASASQDATAIQSEIASSGATPAEAQAALDIVQGSGGLCPEAKVAVASVNASIQEAMASPAAGPGGGPGGGSPIGAPPAYVSGGGSNYLAP